MLDVNNVTSQETPNQVILRGNIRWWAPTNAYNFNTKAQPVIDGSQDLDLGVWISNAIDEGIIDVDTTSVYSVADTAARDALTSLIESDVALITDSDGFGNFGISTYTGSTWGTNITSNYRATTRLIATDTSWQASDHEALILLSNIGGTNLTYTLPASPNNGDKVSFKVNILGPGWTIDVNGGNINGESEDYIFDHTGEELTLEFIAGFGWATTYSNFLYTDVANLTSDGRVLYGGNYVSVVGKGSYLITESNKSASGDLIIDLGGAKRAEQSTVYTIMDPDTGNMSINTDDIVIDTSGNIGLTIATPLERLHLDGNIRLADNLSTTIGIPDALSNRPQYIEFRDWQTSYPGGKDLGTSTTRFLSINCLDEDGGIVLRTASNLFAGEPADVLVMHRAMVGIGINPRVDGTPAQLGIKDFGSTNQSIIKCLDSSDNNVFQVGNSGDVGIKVTSGSNDSSALFQVDSTTQGIMIPRMTLTQRDAIASPSESLLIYQTDNTPGYRYYSNAGTWEFIGGSGGSASIANSADINQTAHGFTIGDAIKSSGASWVAVGAGETPEAMVASVVDANNFVLVVNGLFEETIDASWAAVLDGDYYWTNAGYNTTPDTPERPFFVKSNGYIFVQPFLAFTAASMNLFDLTEVSGTTTIAQGDTVTLDSAETIYSTTWIDGSTAITNVDQALDLLIANAENRANRVETTSQAYQTSDRGALVVMNNSSLTYTLPAGPTNSTRLKIMFTGASGTIDRNGENINGAASNFTTITTGQIYHCEYVSTYGWVIS